MFYILRKRLERKKEGVQVLDFRESTRGKPYDFKLRETVYTL